MKTAISLPDELFKEAEKYAKKHRLSRSELFSRALKDYLRLRDEKVLTEAVNAVLEETDNELHPAWIQAQIRAVGKEDW